MRRYLLAWELGGDLGHARRQAAIARGLRRLGHEVLLAFADLGAVDAAALDGIAWVAAPRVTLPERMSLAPVSASDILVNMGYGDEAALGGAVAGWSSLIRAFGPNAVVSDYAPAAALAALWAGVPRIAVGSGFSSPPRGEPMPALHPRANASPEMLARIDATLAAAMRGAGERASARGQAAARARDFFEADAHLVCAWPELDPFGPRTGVEYLGPQAGGEASPPIEWQRDTGKRVFAYLKPRDERFVAMIGALSKVADEAIVAAPGLPAAEAASVSRERVRVLPHAVDLPAVLARADLCIAHSGAGTVAAATQAGVPLALLPRNIEQWLIAQRAQSLGHAVMPAEGQPLELVAWLSAALASEGLREAAREARRIARPAADAASRIAELA